MLARFILITTMSGILYGTLGFVAGLHLAERTPVPQVDQDRSLTASDCSTRAI